jgi:hypothetical protein
MAEPIEPTAGQRMARMIRAMRSDPNATTDEPTNEREHDDEQASTPADEMNARIRRRGLGD